MAVTDQVITDRYGWYNADCIEVMQGMPKESIHFSVYSPPFSGEGRQGALYHYSSSPRDLSNARNYAEFSQHYEFVVSEITRLTLPGRMTAVHCMDVPRDGANTGAGMTDFPGDIIRMHDRLGWIYYGSHYIWKEPLEVRNRTLAKGLAHMQVVEDSSLCTVASCDRLLMFLKRGQNPIPVAHPTGLDRYAGEREIPRELLQYKNWKGKQTENRFSHWIWRQYASSVWMDIRIDHVLDFKEARGEDDERHMHPLQLDVIERAVVMRSNPGEIVLTPFGGVGSEVFGSVINGRMGVGIELKQEYWRQGCINLARATENKEQPDQQVLFA